jgi:hypothetical protein
VAKAGFDDLKSLDLEELPSFFPDDSATLRNAAIELDESERIQRKAAKRIHKNLTQVANATKHLGELPPPGFSLHCITKGNYAAWDLVPAVLEMTAPAYIERLSIATLSYSASNAAQLVELFDAGRIRRVAFLCSSYFEGTSGTEFQDLAAAMADRRQRFAAVRTHAKIIGLRLSNGAAYAIELSANLRSCRNVEQFAIHHDADLLAFHEKWIDHLLTKAGA